MITHQLHPNRHILSIAVLLPKIGNKKMKDNHGPKSLRNNFETCVQRYLLLFCSLQYWGAKQRWIRTDLFASSSHYQHS